MNRSPRLLRTLLPARIPGKKKASTRKHQHRLRHVAGLRVRRLRDQETKTLDKGEWVDPRSGRSNFGEYASALLSVKRATVAPRTHVNIEGRWRNHIEPVFGECQIASIRPIDVRKWVASMLDGGMAPLPQGNHGITNISQVSRNTPQDDRGQTPRTAAMRYRG